MKIEMPSGRYIVAVSGGVDSVVLLDLMRLYPDVKITVAHYDHGIRANSTADKVFVYDLTRRYKLPFVYDQGNLGVGASEAVARRARYAFLRRAATAIHADAIVTAHHQDDVLETAIINLLRGTGRKGLSSLTSGEGIIRPLLRVPKSEIIDYAKRHGLHWREDNTNDDTTYLRNHVRHNILPGWSEEDKRKLLAMSWQMQDLNSEIDDILRLNLRPELQRSWFVLLPHRVATEVMAAWLRNQGIRDFDRVGIERLTVAGKTATAGKAIDITRGHRMVVGKDSLALQ